MLEEVAIFHCEIFRGEPACERAPDRGGLAALRKAAQHAREQPMGVHRGMPVVAAVERRMQLARPLQVRGALHDMARLAGKLALEGCERESSEALGLRGIHAMRA